MRNRILGIVTKNRLLIIFIVFIIIISLASDNFLTTGNLINLLLHVSVDGIMALGLTVLLISGAFDLSIGSNLGLVSLITVWLQSYVGLPMSIIFGILTGCLIGLVNGLLVTYGKINAFITTLGTLILIKGLALSMNNGTPIPNTIPEFTIIGVGQIGPIPLPVIYFVVFTLIFWFLMKYTAFGRNAYAIGGNEMAAKVSGINVNLYKVMYFVLSGFCAGLAGIILASKLNTGSIIFGDSTPIIVISAVILGGTSLKGGIGTINGTILGILIIGVFNNSMNLLNVQSYYQLVIKGIILIVVVQIDAYYEKVRAAGGLQIRKG
jgi:ribose/xylose/arabinose/galactoside ABC-type transport system permease subunit